MTGSKKKTNMAAHGPTQTCIAGANSGFNTDPNTAGGQTAASQQAGHDQLPRQGATSIQGTQISAATPQPERQTQ